MTLIRYKLREKIFPELFHGATKTVKEKYKLTLNITIAIDLED
jgi:hypothetical protein